MLELRRWKTNLIKKHFFKFPIDVMCIFSLFSCPGCQLILFRPTTSHLHTRHCQRERSQHECFSWVSFSKQDDCCDELEFNHYLHPDLIDTKGTVSESWQLSVTWLLSGCSECVALKTSCGCTFLRSSLVCVTLFTISLLLGDYFVHLCYRVGVFHANCTAVHLRPK